MPVFRSDPFLVPARRSDPGAGDADFASGRRIVRRTPSPTVSDRKHSGLSLRPRPSRYSRTRAAPARRTGKRSGRATASCCRRGATAGVSDSADRSASQASPLPRRLRRTPGGSRDSGNSGRMRTNGAIALSWKRTLSRYGSRSGSAVVPWRASHRSGERRLRSRESGFGLRPVSRGRRPAIGPAEPVRREVRPPPSVGPARRGARAGRCESRTASVETGQVRRSASGFATI